MKPAQQRCCKALSTFPLQIFAFVLFSVQNSPTKRQRGVKVGMAGWKMTRRRSPSLLPDRTYFSLVPHQNHQSLCEEVFNRTVYAVDLSDYLYPGMQFIVCISALGDQ